MSEKDNPSFLSWLFFFDDACLFLSMVNTPHSLSTSHSMCIRDVSGPSL